ncbi:MAG: hypothetical protein Q7S33_06060 [Nanoarchaeota archaeon]|nr:hypothetical protein [Nanoarchaeota archaeon]
MKKTALKKPIWLKMDEEALKKIIAELAEKYEAPQIGLILRDQYGIPTTRLYGKKLNQYLKEIGKGSHTELKNIEKKYENMKKHISENPTDKKAKHKFQKAQSRLSVIKRNIEKKRKK